MIHARPVLVEFLSGDTDGSCSLAIAGHAVAQAAWFNGHPSVTKLWKTFCQRNCDATLDMVARHSHSHVVNSASPRLASLNFFTPRGVTVYITFYSSSKRGLDAGWAGRALLRAAGRPRHDRTTVAELHAGY